MANILSGYIKQIYNIPILTPSEELRIACLAKQGDYKARNKLIISNLRFVVSAAKHFSKTCKLSFEDLLQSGNEGLCKAFQKYNPKLGYRFITYAIFHINQCIRQAISKNYQLSMPIDIAMDISKIHRILVFIDPKCKKSELEVEISNISGLSQSHVHNILQACKEFRSLDELVFKDFDDMTFADTLSDPRFLTPDFSFDKKIIHQNFVLSLSRLCQREKFVIQKYYGLDNQSNHGISFAKIGILMHLSRERVRQIHDNAICHLRNSDQIQALKNYFTA